MQTLKEIGKKYPTSKNRTGFIPIYEHFFDSLREKEINILEIGVENGYSLKLWREYFINAKICGIDIDKKDFSIDNVEIFCGDQSDHNFLSKVVEKYGKFDIIIDDGSHLSKHIISSFNYLFDHLNEDGLYIIEDLQTSYMPRYGGSRLNLNKKKLQLCQKNNYKNFYLDHKYVSNIIDHIRFTNIHKPINFKRDNTLKIIHITNFNYRFDGRLQYNTGRRINNGFVRLGHNVLTISDRDILNQNKNILDPMGKNYLQSKIIKNIDNFKPDLIVIGHADSISSSTLNLIKEKNIKICQWFLDPVTKYGPDYTNNKKRILEKSKLMDATFLTTDPLALDFDIKNSFFIPNPCDKSFEILKKNETEKGFAEAVTSHKDKNKKKVPFFYLGPKNDWQKILNENLKVKLTKNFEKELKELSYI